MSAKIWIKYDDGKPKQTTDKYDKEDPISKVKLEKECSVIKYDGKRQKLKDKIPTTTTEGKPLHFISKIGKSTILLLLP